MKNGLNHTMLFDFYELTMANGYFRSGMDKQICYFDVFFRSVPDGGGFAIAAVTEQRDIADVLRSVHIVKILLSVQSGRDCGRHTVRCHN